MEYENYDFFTTLMSYFVLNGCFKILDHEVLHFILY